MGAAPFVMARCGAFAMANPPKPKPGTETRRADCTGTRSASFITALLVVSNAAVAEQSPVQQLMDGRAREADVAYRQNRFSPLTRDYLTRFRRDPLAKARANEVTIRRCAILLPPRPSIVAQNLATLLRDFLVQRMNVQAIIDSCPKGASRSMPYKIGLQEQDATRTSHAHLGLGFSETERVVYFGKIWNISLR